MQKMAYQRKTMFFGEKKVNTDSICKLCGKFKRGHICIQHKKNSAMKIKLESFFSKLFV